jgi:hypothetical protein
MLYGTGHSSGAPEINPGFSGVRVNMETPRKLLNKYWCLIPHYLSDIRKVWRYQRGNQKRISKDRQHTKKTERGRNWHDSKQPYCNNTHDIDSCDNSRKYNKNIMYIFHTYITSKSIICVSVILCSSALLRKIVGTLGTIKVLLPSYPVNKCIILEYAWLKFKQKNMWLKWYSPAGE